MEIIKKVKEKINGGRALNFIVITVIMVLTLSKSTMAQEKQMVRLAKIEVDASQLKKYNAALKQQMNAAIKLESGVLTYYAVADKKKPWHITILEVYADTAAYKSHIETPHFKKYKATVGNMVKALELVDVDVIEAVRKPGM